MLWSHQRVRAPAFCLLTKTWVKLRNSYVLSTASVRNLENAATRRSDVALLVVHNPPCVYFHVFLRTWGRSGKSSEEVRQCTLPAPLRKVQVRGPHTTHRFLWYIPTQVTHLLRTFAHSLSTFPENNVASVADKHKKKTVGGGARPARPHPCIRH